MKYILGIVLLSLVVGSCTQKDEEFPDPPVSDITIESTPRVFMKVNGDEVIINTPDFSNGMSGDFSYGVPPDPSRFKYYSEWTQNGMSRFSIGKGTLIIPNGGLADSADFRNFFVIGNGTYSIDAEDGYEISYTDDSGTFWSTSLGTGNQANASLMIDEIIQDNFLFEQRVKFLIRFNCTLYDGNGSNRVVRDGICTGHFGKLD